MGGGPQPAGRTSSQARASAGQMKRGGLVTAPLRACDASPCRDKPRPALPAVPCQIRALPHPDGLTRQRPVAAAHVTCRGAPGKRETGQIVEG